MPRNASVVFSHVVRQELLDALAPVRGKVQSFLDGRNDRGLAEFAVRGALRTYQGAKNAGFLESDEVLALSRTLQQICAGIGTHSTQLTPDELGELSAQAFRQGGRVHALLRKYQPTG